MSSALFRATLPQDERLAECSVLACLGYVYAHLRCDSFGRLKGSSGWWAMHVLPGRGSVSEVSSALGELVACGVLRRYEVDGEPFVVIVDWFKTQSFQELYMMRAQYPNPDTGEVEQTMPWRDARDHFGLRRRKERPTVIPQQVTVRNEAPSSVTVRREELTVNRGATITTVTTEDSSTSRAREIDWLSEPDRVVAYMGQKISEVRKYANASRPATVQRVTDLVARMRTEAPDDQAICDLVDNWFDFHSADTDAKYGKGDPVASMRQQLGFARPRWAAAVARANRGAASRQVRRDESMADELSRITSQ